MKAFLLAALIAPAAFAQQIRIEPRLFVKDHHYFLSGGLTWLERVARYSRLHSPAPTIFQRLSFSSDYRSPTPITLQRLPLF